VNLCGLLFLSDFSGFSMFFSGFFSDFSDFFSGMLDFLDFSDLLESLSDFLSDLLSNLSVLILLFWMVLYLIVGDFVASVLGEFGMGSTSEELLFVLFFSVLLALVGIVLIVDEIFALVGLLPSVSREFFLRNEDVHPITTTSFPWF